MIQIRDLDLPTTNIVGAQDKTIGTFGDMNFERRIFSIPRIYRNVDISGGDFSFTLQVVNSAEIPYMNVLDKTVTEDTIELTWSVARHDCVVGNIDVSILIQKFDEYEEVNSIIKQTYPMRFVCIEGINAKEFLEKIPPNIFEQAVIQSGVNAQNARIEVDNLKREINELRELIEIVAANTDTVVLTEDIVVTGTSVGAIGDGEIIRAKTSLTDIFNRMFVKIIHPIYIRPTLHTTISEEYDNEIGSILSPLFTSVWNQNDAGIVNGYYVNKNGTIYTDLAVSPFREPEFHLTEDVSYSTMVSYESGAIKTNNLGEPDPTGSIQAGSIYSNIITLTANRKMFYGSDAAMAPLLTSNQARSLPENMIRPFVGIPFVIHVPIGNRRISICYPATINDISSIKHVEQANIEYKELFQKSIVDVEGANGYEAIPYKVFTWIMASPAVSAMTLNVTI